MTDGLSRLVIVFFGIAVAGCTSLGPAVNGDMAFVGVNVVAIEPEIILENQTVVIEGDRIVKIGPAEAITLPRDTTIIEGRGRYLVPGLAEMHGHPMTADDLIIYLANGITTIRAMWGEPSILNLRDAVNQGLIPGPRVYAAGRMVDGARPIHYGTVALKDPAKAEDVMTSQMAAGYDFVKIYSNMSLEVFDAVAVSAERNDIEFSGHVPWLVPLDHALKSGMRTMEHFYGFQTSTLADPGLGNPELAAISPAGRALVEKIGRGDIDISAVFDERKIDEIAEQTAESGVWLVPTFEVLKSFTSKGPAQHPGAERYLLPGTRAGWAAFKNFGTGSSEDYLRGQDLLYEMKLAILSEIRKAGGRVLVGTDAPNPGVYPGFSVVDEMANLTDAGFSNAEALRAATYVPAEYLGNAEDYGHVAEGAIADLILVDGNPYTDLDVLRLPDGVMRAGVWRTRSELDGFLEAVAERSAIDAEFDGAPSLPANFGLPADFLRSDGAAFRVGIERGDGGSKVVVGSRARLGGDWTAFALERSGNTITLDRPNGARPITLTTEDDVILLREGDDVLAKSKAGGVPVLITDTPADILALYDALDDVETGQSRLLQIWHCVPSIGCNDQQPETWTARRLDDDVIDGYFYYTGSRVFEFQSDGETRPATDKIWIGGGFYEGQPVRIDFSDKDASAWRRIR